MICNNHKICLNFLICGFIGQLTIIQRLYSMRISRNYLEVKTQVVDYSNYLNMLKDLKGMGKLLSTRESTKVCGRNSAQLLTLCRWIASSETYKENKFVLVRIERFLPMCYPNYFKFSGEKDRRSLEMVACPYIKKQNLDAGLNDERLAAQPGILFVTGCLGKHSALVFISHFRNNEIIYEPSGYVTEIDMISLRTKTNYKKAVRKATEANRELMENLKTEEPDEFANVDPSERPLFFKDLL